MLSRALLLLLAAATGAAADAQAIVVSARPDHVEVTVYRNPNRQVGTPLDRAWLDGFALVTETRRITLAPGETEIRFEGVAGGIVPQSAIVTGLPDGIVERNRDAYLLSPGTLVDRSLGRRVTIRRTSHATGGVTESEAVIRGTANGVVLQTPDGFEALRCTGLDETLIMSEVPPGLSARPTLSVRARVRAPVTATVTLSYLASGFDWQANYIVNLSDDGVHADFFAWMTLASTDETSFRDADVQAVAGRLNHEATRAEPREGGPLNLRCWPQATTSDIPRAEFERLQLGSFPGGQDVVVTGTRMRSANLVSAAPITVVTAQQEELGDLKLYRIPERVTLAANSQKQVALLNRPGIALRLVYATYVHVGSAMGTGATWRMLRARNVTADGLGLPLPAGQVQIFGERGGQPFLLGNATMRDLAIGEDVEFQGGGAPGVMARVESGARGRDFVLTVTNDQPSPVAYEARFVLNGHEEVRAPGLIRRNGVPIWEATVPGNGSVTLRFRRVRR